MPPEVEENEVTTENAILNTIEGIENDSTPNKDESAQEGAATPEGDEGNSSSNGQTDATNEQGNKDDKGQGSSNGPQDLIGPDGKVIAKGGEDRRHFERAQKLSRDLEASATTIERLNGELEAYKSTANLGTQYGLSPQELSTGAQIMAAYKNNPVETVKYLLTQVQAMGHDIEDVGAGGVSMASIRQMISEAVSPLTSKVQEEQEANTRREQAQRTYDTFITNYPDAQVHVETIAQMMRQDDSLSLNAAYYKLQAEYAKRGLDWGKSLKQLQEEATSTSTTPINKTPDLPTGNGANQSGVTDTDAPVSVDTSTDDIIRQAMREAGI